ncbi:Protein of unknown function [Planifilum fulgidum]|jgi:hypothetical protein|uniref:DUF2487 domain-containing protein n=1 Tax=Planifilum fulgidum TaxID=201973 RepID=A0A1I2LBH2_9BACL|nr:DUF2487 family protein [Planifilum fulgidum]SFF75809.1 Protein of unknown function [Planifilum fulgidum]
MRLTEMRQDEWTKVAPYVDTLCLPVYRTAFSEKRIRLEERRVVEAVADRVERALTGRLLLLPAIAYEGGDREAFRAYLGNVLAELARSAFHHLVIVVPEDLAEAAEARGKIAVHPLPSRNEATEEEIEEWAEALRERIVRLWQGADDENASDEES